MALLSVNERWSLGLRPDNVSEKQNLTQGTVLQGAAGETNAEERSRCVLSSRLRVSGMIRAPGCSSVRTTVLSDCRHRECAARGRLLTVRRRQVAFSAGRRPKAPNGGGLAELPYSPNVRAAGRLGHAGTAGGGRGEGGGAGHQLRARGGGGARCVVPAGPGLLPLPRPGQRRAELLPRLDLSPLPSARQFLPPAAASSSVRRSSSGQAAWRPWRRGCARQTAAAVRPSSSVPLASSWASRARTSARR